MFYGVIANFQFSILGNSQDCRFENWELIKEIDTYFYLILAI